MRNLTLLLFILHGAAALAAPPSLGGRADVRGERLRRGRLRDRVMTLPPDARAEAERFMRGFAFPEHDCGSIHCGHRGGLYYACEFQPVMGAEPQPAESEPVVAAAAVPVSPFPAGLQFESKPGSANVIFLDFDGHVITGTDWNNTSGVTTYTAQPFSTDTDYANYLDTEQAIIKRVWQRVAEDYAPFDVNVTTKAPATFNTRTIRCVITRNTDAAGVAMPSSGAGGVAYVGVFATSSMAYYSPAFVYHNNLSNNESYIAEAAAHECGHNLGLSHDGTTAPADYYGGHGSGDTAWGPIMGASYGRSVTQWCKGDYYLANNTQDDLSILSGKMPYRADDVGGTTATAAYLLVDAAGVVAVTTPEADPANATTTNKGRLERNTDVDMWAFNTGPGIINLTVRPWVSPLTPKGGNIDVRARLLNGTGAVVADINDAALTAATINTNLPPGTYYLEITNVGAGTPTASPPTGYTSYGGVGQYFISGTVQPADAVIIPPQASGAFTGITTTGVGPKTLQVVYTDNVAVNVATLGTGDIRVTGPGGYNQIATFVSVNNTANGTPRTATYSVPPPSGVEWINAHDGLYTVEVIAGQVADVESAFVAPSMLGTFAVAVPRRIYFANMDSNPGWTLDPQWAYGPAVGSTYDPSSAATGTNLIGYNIGGDYANNLTAKYATTPPIDCRSGVNITLQFKRWLSLRIGDTAWIQSSPNGTTWTDVWRTTSTIADASWQSVQFDLTAAAAGQAALRLRWGISSNSRTARGGWSLDDVEVLASGTPPDTTPPSAFLQSLNLTTAGGPGHEFTVTYTDNTAVDAAGIDDLDLLVLGPNAYSNDCVRTGLNELSDGTPRVATYSCAAPPGGWDAADNGTYQVFLRENQVFDTANNPATAGLLGTFQISITPTFQLSVAASPPEGGLVIPAGGAYPQGTTVVLEAVPSEYYQFAGWSGAVVSTNNPLSVVMDGNMSLTAAFSEQLTDNTQTPLLWLVGQGITNDFATAALQTGANGLPLWQSYVAGLNPADPDDTLALGVELGGAGRVITWSAVSGRVYTVRHSGGLAGPFLPLPGGSALPWPANSVTDTVHAAESEGFYLLEVDLP